MISISIIILTNNSEEVLEDCLKSIKDFGSEIVVIDSNSTDKTLDIARTYKAKIIKNKLVSFSEQRNLGRDNANSKWIFYLDSDERITNEFKEEVEKLVSTYDEKSSVVGYYVKRKTYYLNRDWGFEDKVQRLFYKKKFIEWYGEVHETPKVEGEYGEISTHILHLTHRNLEQMVDKTNKWSEIEAKLRFSSHHPRMSWWRFPRVMATGFFRSYFHEKGYRNGTEGLIESIFQAFSMFITYAKLWEMQEKK